MNRQSTNATKFIDCEETFQDDHESAVQTCRKTDCGSRSVVAATRASTDFLRTCGLRRRPHRMPWSYRGPSASSASLPERAKTPEKWVRPLPAGRPTPTGIASPKNPNFKNIGPSAYDDDDDPPGRPWSPFDHRSDCWQTASLLEVARAHHETMGRLDASFHMSSTSDLMRSRRGRISTLSMPTLLYKAHVWPPHNSLSPRGLQRQVTRERLYPPPFPMTRIRSPLRDPSRTTVFGAPAGVPTVHPPRRVMRDYVSPRPANTSYGMTSTSMGVGRPGYWMQP